MIVNQVQRSMQPAHLGLITPQINRLDLNGCVGCVRGLGAPTDVLLAVWQKLASAGSYLAIGTGPGAISNAERLAVNDALFELDSPSSFATTSVYNTLTVVGNPTSVSQLKTEIGAALKKAGVTPPASSGRPKWLIPALIGGGVLVAGGIVFAIMKR